MMLGSGYNFVLLEISNFRYLLVELCHEISNLHIFSLSFGYSVWRSVHVVLASTVDVTMCVWRG